jgi:hypothetical protein
MLASRSPGSSRKVALSAGSRLRPKKGGRCTGRDGKPDLVVAEPSDVLVLLGNGDGTFHAEPGTFGPGAGFQTGGFTISNSAVALADLNGDGTPDLVAANNGDITVSVLLGNGDGTFGPPTTFAVDAQPEAVAIADLNRDGHPDLVTANDAANTLSVLLQTASTHATTVASVSGSGTYGTTATLTATLSSNSTPASGESIDFTLGGLSVGSATTGGNGVATLTSVSLAGYNAGTHTGAVSATFAGDATYDASGPTTGDLTVDQASQAITVTTTAPATAANNSMFTVAATGGGSSNAVSYGSAGGCTNSGATYTMTSDTTDCTVTFDQAGDGNYAAAPQVTETVTASGPTFAYVASATVHHAGRQITVQWQMRTSHGVEGFHVYGGTRLMTRSILPVHAGSRYRFTARYGGAGSVHLGVILTSGQEVRVALH